MANDFDLQIKWLNGSQIEIQANDGSSLTGVEKILVIQNGIPKEFTTQDIANLGGGSSSYLVAEVTLTNAQIKALPTTAVQIVAAPGVSKAIKPLYGFAYANYDEGNEYTGLTDASLSFVYTQGGGIPISCPAKTETLLGTSNTPTLDIACPAVVAGTGTFSPYSVTNTDYDLADCENKPLLIKDLFNGGSPYTGGNAANTLKLIVYYVVVDL